MLGTVIDTIDLKKSAIPCWGDQVTIYPYQGNGSQENMIVDARFVRRIGERAHQVNSGKQSNGTLFSVAIPYSRRVHCLCVHDIAGH